MMLRSDLHRRRAERAHPLLVQRGCAASRDAQAVGIGWSGRGAVSPECDGQWGARDIRADCVLPRILVGVRQDSITLEFAIRKMTSLLLLSVSGWPTAVCRPVGADITVFDPKTIIDNATFEQPQQSTSGKLRFVNGISVLDEGRPMGALPGRSPQGSGYRERLRQ